MGEPPLEKTTHQIGGRKLQMVFRSCNPPCPVIQERTPIVTSDTSGLSTKMLAMASSNVWSLKQYMGMTYFSIADRSERRLLFFTAGASSVFPSTPKGNRKQRLTRC